MSATDLDRLAGLDRAVRAVRALASGRSTAQSVLIYGGPATGKTTLARWLAGAWLCTGTERPCGSCPACRTLASGGNPDFLMLEPKGAGGLIRLAAICPTTPPDEAYPVSLRDFFRLSPLVSPCKVAVIEQAERMTPDAANALLKVLEEPQPSQRLILTTREIGWVLPTVVSRCVGVACEARRPAGDAVDALFGPFAQPERRASNEELFAQLAEWVGRLPSRDPSEALVASDELQDFAERLQKAEGLNPRQARAEVLRMVAEASRRLGEFDPQTVEAFAEAHRRVLGNVQAGLAFDSLMASVLSRRRRTAGLGSVGNSG
ncbi:MAG: hypothetical protein LDL56_12210 [Armatimonadetes bacterium]|nr:hypothetical protein [Armatimonadota bacterium]